MKIIVFLLFVLAFIGVVKSEHNIKIQISFDNSNQKEKSNMCEQDFNNLDVSNQQSSNFVQSQRNIGTYDINDYVQVLHMDIQ